MHNGADSYMHNGFFICFRLRYVCIMVQNCYSRCNSVRTRWHGRTTLLCQVGGASMQAYASSLQITLEALFKNYVEYSERSRRDPPPNENDGLALGGGMDGAVTLVCQPQMVWFWTSS